MRTASQLFYLAVFGLLGACHADNQQRATQLQNSGPERCPLEPNAIVSDACVSYKALDDINKELAPVITSITHNTDFFSYYRLNLFNRACPFWSDETAMCGNIACAVQTLENEEDIPPVWRAEELGKLEGPKAEHPGRKQQEEHKSKPLMGGLGENVGESCVVEYDDECDERDYCVPEDESATGNGDYVSLLDNPERFTGYIGASAQQVWDTVYRENCFSKGQKTVDVGKSELAAFDLRSVMKEHGRHQAATEQASQGTVDDGLEFDDECLEKRAFYRIVSGMHSSISTHLCWEHLNQTTGEWGPNLVCYEKRLHNFPDRISNLYFNYALVLRTVGKLRNHLKDYTFCSGDLDQDRQTKYMVLSLVDRIAAGPKIFDETVMFQDPSAIGLKEDFRNRFRNVSRLMDCVGCDKCRLWGKLQTSGYGTALKVLFEFDETNDALNPRLRRTELVALVNTLGRISHSMSAIVNFQKMVEARDAGVPFSAEQKRKLFEESAQVEEIFVDADDDYDVDTDEKPHNNSNDGTWSTAWNSETKAIYDAFLMVIRSWISLPGTIYEIFVIELSRLWDYWIGVPVRPRTWEIRPFNHEEL
ncbi:endoplasmic oxidoreductin [Xylona heveae TC161]|uniref:Endoplasmic oxidoreductin n=1 Tax=Xylona heveae (strain CBS 132557 / TC161) TaxID=1328760 RepID=A0A165JEA5_XYLHT|nr:endoplasmic oxidoreductin [Xylona heveae TC161]KZF26126.1 endoplasmic oxidoreductin [Xylona heveae TC161]